jgi:hypothetical protein
MLMQVIEHLDQGGLWGNMLEVLACLIAPPGKRKGALPFQLRTSLPCPGFLIAPAEEEESWRLQKELFSMQVDGRSLGEYLGAVND